MHEEHLLLHFKTAPNRYPDTVIAAQALMDWAALVQATIHAISPEDRISIEIVGVVPGSTRFPQILRFLDDQAGNVREAWAEYPHLKAVVAGAAHTFYTSLVAASVSIALMPDKQIVQLSDEDRAILSQMRREAEKSGAVIEANKRFYRTIEADRAIEGVAATTDWHRRDDLLIVPRAEFAERSGLWELQGEQEQVQKRPMSDTWDVVLLKAPFSSEPRRWQFSRDGLKFSAQMSDPVFLQAIKERRVPITLQEGVNMRIQVEYQEILRGQVWEAIQSSRKVVRVLSPIPLSQSPPNKP